MTNDEPNDDGLYKNDVVARRLQIDCQLVDKVRHSPYGNDPQHSQEAYEQDHWHTLDRRLMIKNSKDQIEGQQAEEVYYQTLISVVLEDVFKSHRRSTLEDDLGSQFNDHKDKLQTK